MHEFEAVLEEGRGGGAGLRHRFDGLSHTHRREHVEAIEGAKKPETRARRISNAVEMLAG